MYVVLLCGGIASGKSSVGRALAARGARVLDLDAISREVTSPGEPAVSQIAQEFGGDVVGDDGAIDRSLLAARAFESSEATRRLEAIVHPAIYDRLERRLQEAGDEAMCVVEVPLLDRVEALASRVDEVLCVTCPCDIRRGRAVARGMDAADFDARVAQQPSDDYLVQHADTLLNNEGDETALMEQLDAWWESRLSQRGLPDD